MRIRYLASFFGIFLLVSGFMPLRNNAITSVCFKNMVGNKEMVLFDEMYVNSFGEPFFISKFRYYISHISFIDVTNRETSLPGNYYLVNEADSLSKIIQLPAAAAIKSISFFVGVDSA